MKAKKIKKNKPKPARKVEYALNVEYKGMPNLQLDTELNTLIGKHSEDCGYMMGDDIRDATWYFSSKALAKTAHALVADHPKLLSASVHQADTQDLFAEIITQMM